MVSSGLKMLGRSSTLRVLNKEEMMPNNCNLFIDVEKNEEEFNTKTRKANRNDALSYNIWSNNNVNVKKFNKKK